MGLRPPARSDRSPPLVLNHKIRRKRPIYLFTNLPATYLPIYLPTHLLTYLATYLPIYLPFFWSGRGGSKLPSQWPYDARTPPVPREHSFGGACSEPLYPSPWLSLSLLTRPLNLAVKGLGVQTRQLSRIWEPSFTA